MFGLSFLRAWWCACAHGRVLELVRVHQAFGRMEGVLERAVLFLMSKSRTFAKGEKKFRSMIELEQGPCGQKGVQHCGSMVSAW